MPVYPYYCKKCECEFDVIKLLKDIDNEEKHLKCGEFSVERRIGYSAIDRSSVFEPYFEPALGTIIRSKSQKARVLREKGAVEVGNEPTQNFEKYLEREREKRWEKAWEAV